MEGTRAAMENSLLSIITTFNDDDLKAFLKTMLSLIDENNLKIALDNFKACNSEKGVSVPVAVVAEEAKATADAKEEPVDEDADVRKVMRETGLDWENAWVVVRVKELEDGASICCSEEWEGHTSALSVLVAAAKMGKRKRKARRRAEGHSVSDDEDDAKSAYVAPPRVRDADKYWPYARCKNIVGLIKKPFDIVPRNHNALLEYISGYTNVTVDELKKEHPRKYFKNHARVSKILNQMY